MQTIRLNVYQETRGACRRSPAPCQRGDCRYHTSELRHQNRELDQDRSETCALNLADRGGMTLEEVGKFAGVTRERVRQLQAAALQSLELGLRAMGWKGRDIREALDAAHPGVFGSESEAA